MHHVHPQRQRRRVFTGLLVALFVAIAAVEVLPVAEAEETVVAAGADPAAEAVATTVVTEPVPTTEAPTTTTTAAPTTTAPKPTTTTTAAPKPTTTAPRVPATAPPTTAAPAPPPPPPPTPVASGPGPTADEAAYLACVRRRESGGNYAIVSSNGLYYGAYQFLRSSWDATARHAGRSDLVGIPPNQVAPGDQDAMALVLLRWQGKAPWGGAC